MGSVTLLELRMCGEKRKWRGAQSEGLGPPGAVGATEGLQAARVLCRRFSYDLTGCAIPDAFASFHFSPISQLWITPGSVFSLANLIQSHDFKYHAYKMTFKFISIILYCPLESRLVCSTTNPLSPRGYLIGKGNMRIHCQTLRLPHKTHSSLLVNASSILLIDGTQNFRDVIGFSH